MRAACEWLCQVGNRIENLKIEEISDEVERCPEREGEAPLSKRSLIHQMQNRQQDNEAKKQKSRRAKKGSQVVRASLLPYRSPRAWQLHFLNVPSCPSAQPWPPVNSFVHGGLPRWILHEYRMRPL